MTEFIWFLIGCAALAGWFAIGWISERRATTRRHRHRKGHTR